MSSNKPSSPSQQQPTVGEFAKMASGQPPLAQSPSSLSTEDYSSRYSSLADTESLRSAILDSFRMHWIQAWSIMECKILTDITMDDLSSIVNHLEQMISLLVEESCNSESRTNNNSLNDSKCSVEVMEATTTTTTATILAPVNPLLDFLFLESILDKIFQWSEMSGEWKFAMYLEQLKLYELLISQLCQTDLMCFERHFLKPLIRLLDALATSIHASIRLVNFVEIEKRLVVLLNTLCVAISQNNRLLELFLTYELGEKSGRAEEESSPETLVCDRKSQKFSFSIFLLLIQFVHRDGPVGQQARDSLLLCLSITRCDDRLARYIRDETDFCPVLATGLSALFSSLPRVLIGQSMSAEQFQFKDDLLHSSAEIEQFLKCLDFCNAVAQISHSIIQNQLLKFIYDGFLVSVIGPALHQDIGNVSIEDLESFSRYSNTLDEIITTTAYLDLFIRSISEPNLIRIFLQFLCFETYDCNSITATLIKRINAKSKLSLITLILFKTLLDLNCEDLLFELMYKHLLRGKHLSVDSVDVSNQAYSSYQQNWLSISAQKLFLNSLSHYLNSLCVHQSKSHSSTTTLNSEASLDTVIVCRCHSAYLLSYLDYLNDARINIDRCGSAVKLWKNSYHKPSNKLDDVEDQSIIFCSLDRNLNNNNNNNSCAKLEEEKSVNVVNGQLGHQPLIGVFLATIFHRLEHFFDNDILTNLHLTALITRLCHFPHHLLLSLFFDETLARVEGIPCLLHQLQKLGLEAQNYCDELPNFETTFQSAKINLQSMPIGELDCQLLTAVHHHQQQQQQQQVKNLSARSTTPEVFNKGINVLKNMFFRSSTKSSLHRRNSNVSTVSSTGQVEVIPAGVRFINQKSTTPAADTNAVDRFNELIYNLIVFDEFLMELSAILIEHSLQEFSAR